MNEAHSYRLKDRTLALRSCRLFLTHLDEPLCQQVDGLRHSRVVFREKLDDVFWRSACLEIPAFTEQKVFFILHEEVFKPNKKTIFCKCLFNSCEHFEGVEDCRLHDVVSAGEFLQTILLDFSIIFSFDVSVLLENTNKHAEHDEHTDLCSCFD